MSDMTDLTEDNFAGHFFGGSAFTKPPALYHGLLTALPVDAGSYAEYSTGGYNRQQLDPGSANYTLPADGSGLVQNAVAIDYALPADPAVTHFGVFDAVSGGNLLLFGTLSTSGALIFNIGEWSFTFQMDMDYLSNAMAEHFFGDTSIAQPASMSFVWMSVQPAADGTGGTEIAGTETVISPWTLPSAGNGIVSNTDSEPISPPTAMPATTTGYILKDDSGNIFSRTLQAVSLTPTWTSVMDPGAVQFVFA